MMRGRLWKIGDRIFDLSREGLIMGVLNVTPDSFSDGGEFFEVHRAVEHGLRMAGEGAHIVDVGGESTRPKAEAVTAEEELRRVIPVIEQLRKKSEVIISIDTSKAEVARAAVRAGASIVNDVTVVFGNVPPPALAEPRQIAIFNGKSCKREEIATARPRNASSESCKSSSAGISPIF